MLEIEKHYGHINNSTYYFIESSVINFCYSAYYNMYKKYYEGIEEEYINYILSVLPKCKSFSERIVTLLYHLKHKNPQFEFKDIKGISFSNNENKNIKEALELIYNNNDYFDDLKNEEYLKIFARNELVNNVTSYYLETIIEKINKSGIDENMQDKANIINLFRSQIDYLENVRFLLFEHDFSDIKELRQKVKLIYD